MLVTEHNLIKLNYIISVKAYLWKLLTSLDFRLVKIK